MGPVGGEGDGVGKVPMTWDEIKKNVEEAGGVVTLTMATLREAEGAGKLSVATLKSA